MSLTRRPQQVRGLMDNSEFAQRILDRVTSVLGFNQHDGVTTVELTSQGYIPPANLEGAYLVRIAPDEATASRVETAESDNDACRLTLGPWKEFVNHDPTRPALEQGIHLWMGAAWRHVPLARAA